jgi:hypothetical protein
VKKLICCAGVVLMHYSCWGGCCRLLAGVRWDCAVNPCCLVHQPLLCTVQDMSCTLCCLHLLPSFKACAVCCEDLAWPGSVLQGDGLLCVRLAEGPVLV